MENQAGYGTPTMTIVFEDEQLTDLEKATIATYKRKSEESEWHTQVASRCECKPVKGYSAGVCRMINNTCEWHKCPIRLHLAWFLNR